MLSEVQLVQPRMFAWKQAALNKCSTFPGLLLSV